MVSPVVEEDATLRPLSYVESNTRDPETAAVQLDITACST